jgi:hypothetical protein
MIIDLALAVVLAAVLEGEQLGVPRERLEGCQQVSYRGSPQPSPDGLSGARSTVVAHDLRGEVMWQAVLTFYGVILGAVIGGAVALWQAHLAIRREREARQVVREQKRKDVADAFQRETLLALQDAVADLSAAATRELDRRVANRKASTSWEGTGYGDSLPPDWVEADHRVLKLMVRVFDDDLQRLLLNYRFQLLAVAEASEESKAYEAATLAGTLFPQIHQRIGALLPRVF